MLRTTISAAIAILLFLPIHDFANRAPQGIARRGVEAARPNSSGRFATTEEACSAHEAIQRKQEKLSRSGSTPMDSPAKAAEFFVRQRLSDPENEPYPVEHLRRTLSEIQSRERAYANGLRGAPDPAWQSLGPGNIGGRTRAIAIDPTNPNVMYAGGVSGGIWKSVNGGATWEAADDFMLSLGISTIVIDPTDPDVLYAGTGEGFGPVRSFVRGLGIFKSVDAGATWLQLPGTVEGVPEGAFEYVNKLVISPNDHNRVYAATRSGVWLSTDAGATWSVSLANPNYLASQPSSNGSSEGCTDLVVRNDRNPDTLFAAFGVFDQDGLFRSQDGGLTWEAYTTGVNQGRMTIALAPSNNDIMYLMMADNGTAAPVGQLVNVYRSADGGDSFAGRVDFASTTGPWLLSNLILATGCVSGGTYSQGWYDNVIAVDPVDPNSVWAGGIDLFRSDDAGRSWGIASYWAFYLVTPTPPFYAHPDQHTIVFHPNYNGVSNQTMYVGNDGGIYRTTNARAATSNEDCPIPGDEPLPEIQWEDLNNGYGVTQFYHGDSAADRDTFVGGTQDNGTVRVRSRTMPENWKIIFGGDGGYVAIDPTNSQVMYIEYHEFPTIQKSTNGGNSFTSASNGITDTDGIFITPIAMDQANPNVLWTGGNRPWRTTDGAANWVRVGPNFNGPAQISAIAVAPSDSNTVYLGFTNGYVVRTTNALAASPTWQTFISGLRTAWVSSIAVDPQDASIVYLTYSTFGVPHVFRSPDGGQSWTPIDGIQATGIPEIPAHWIAVRPCDSSQLFVGTEFGVFVSEDTGATWRPYNNGLAHTIVESLDFKDDNTLLAFTHGRGAFLIELPACGGCPGDLNDDGMIGAQDLALLLSVFGLGQSEPGWNPLADLDADGVIDSQDLVLLLSAWGSDCQ